MTKFAMKTLLKLPTLVAVLASTAFGNETQTGLFLFVSHHTGRLGVNRATVTALGIFANVFTI
jgi:hypothetical protein